MIKALIVDDEDPAREEIRYLLEEAGKVEIVAEAAGAREALALIRTLDLDVIFMDIEMPGLSGLEVTDALAEMENKPQVVFVTAYGEHAVKAFELEATDYLVKPIAKERLESTLAKVEQRRSMAATKGKSKTKPFKIDRIPVEKLGKKILLPIDDIIYIRSKDDYSFIHTSDTRYISSLSLGNLEARLGKETFYRIHRGYIVNLHKVLEVIPMYGGTFELVVNDQEKTRVPVSRRRAPGLKELLGL